MKPCRRWQGGENSAGRPIDEVDGRLVSPSRQVYIDHYGPIPKGMIVDHKCDNGWCIEPTHLRLMTQRQNLLRSPITLSAINAAKTHCAHGHPFDKKNTYITKQGKRHCRACDLERHNQAYRNKKR